MYSRVTLLEIDTVRIDMESALELFRREVLPGLRAQNGYRGMYVLASPEGKGLLMSLWDTAEQADAGLGSYTELLSRYLTLFASPPGRERYEVVLAETPQLTRR